MQFHKWLFGPEKFSGLSRNGPQSPVVRRVEDSTIQWITQLVLLLFIRWIVI